MFKDGDTLIHGNYEYKGYQYEIHEDEENKVYALPYYHRNRDEATRYLTAAARAFNDEYQWDKRMKVQ